MIAWAITSQGKLIDRTNYDGIHDPALFFDRKSAQTAKSLYYTGSEYKIVEVDAVLNVREPVCA